MTKPRTPRSLSHAVTRIIAQIGEDAAAKVSGRSRHAVRAWSNPDRTAYPSIAQAIALDAAYRSAGGDGAPLREAYDAQLEITVCELTACHRDLAAEVATASIECGEALGATLPLTQTGYTPNDATRALLQIDDAENALSRVRRRVHSFLPAARGRSAAKAGGTFP